MTDAILFTPQLFKESRTLFLFGEHDTVRLPQSPEDQQVDGLVQQALSLIHITEPTRQAENS